MLQTILLLELYQVPQDLNYQYEVHHILIMDLYLVHHIIADCIGVAIQMLSLVELRQLQPIAIIELFQI